MIRLMKKLTEAANKSVLWDSTTGTMRMGTSNLLQEVNYTFQTIEIEMPDLDSQWKIVGLLETIRRKVEVNNAINENLSNLIPSP